MSDTAAPPRLAVRKTYKLYIGGAFPRLGERQILHGDRSYGRQRDRPDRHPAETADDLAAAENLKRILRPRDEDRTRPPSLKRMLAYLETKTFCTLPAPEPSPHSVAPRHTWRTSGFTSWQPEHMSDLF
jgi:hypothetical protein